MKLSSRGEQTGLLKTKAVTQVAAAREEEGRRREKRRRRKKRGVYGRRIGATNACAAKRKQAREACVNHVNHVNHA